MADNYADADPDEFVVVVGFGPTTLWTAVRMWVETSKVPGDRLTMVAREAGKRPASFEPSDLDRLAELKRFQ